MKPDPSIRIRCSGWPSDGAGSACSKSSASVPSAVTPSRPRVCPGNQHIQARAVRTHHGLILDVQEDAWMPERAVAAIAGDDLFVDMDDLGGCRVGSRAVHLGVPRPLWWGRGRMIAMR